MPDRNAMPPAADHQQHDALLVAQLAAGDALAPEQQAEAQRLVTSCGACAALATDLRAVSAAVAQEPVPPRRRDFRLSPEQAEQLSGNALTRFLRRLSLPSARAFQPAAAGVLSIGLLFVVAGYAWPDGGAITVQAEPNFAVYGTAAPTGEPSVVPAPAAAGSDLDEAAAADELTTTNELEAADGFAAEGLEPADGQGAADGLEVPEPDAEFFETLPESQGGTTDTFDQKSLASGAEQPDVLEEAVAAEEAAPAEEVAVAQDRAPAAEAAPAEEAAAEAAKRAADAVTAPQASAVPEAPVAAPADAADSVSDAAEADFRSEERAAQSMAEEPAVEEELGAVAELEAATEVTGDAEVTDELAVQATDERAPADLLIPLGILLALAGGGLLVLGWLARRARDPLAP